MLHLKSFYQLFEKRFLDAPAIKPKPVNVSGGIMSAADMVDMEFDTIEFSGDWQELFGNPAPNFDMLIHGEPGSGKTTFLLKFAKYLSLNFGKVFYVSSEEYGAATLTKMLQDYEIVSENLFFANDLSEPLDNYDFIIIDSVNDMGLTLAEFKDLREQYPMTAFILVLQHTKSGDYRGGKDWEHEVEIAGEVVEGVVTMYRNRYGVKGSLNIFEPISNKDRTAPEDNDSETHKHHKHKDFKTKRHHKDS